MVLHQMQSHKLKLVCQVNLDCKHISTSGGEESLLFILLLKLFLCLPNCFMALTVY